MKTTFLVAGLVLGAALALATPASASPGVCAGDWQALGGSCTVQTFPHAWFVDCGDGTYYLTTQFLLTQCIFPLP
jgi:hypothetical protein